MAVAVTLDHDRTARSQGWRRKRRVGYSYRMLAEGIRWRPVRRGGDRPGVAQYHRGANDCDALEG